MKGAPEIALLQSLFYSCISLRSIYAIGNARVKYKELVKVNEGGNVLGFERNSPRLLILMVLRSSLSSPSADTRPWRACACCERDLRSCCSPHIPYGRIRRTRGRPWSSWSSPPRSRCSACQDALSECACILRYCD